MVMCCLLLTGGGTQAFSQDDGYNPANPEEPSVVNVCRLTVSADPVEAAYCSGGGKYKVNGNSVYVSSSARNTSDYTYTFLYWTLNGVRTYYSQDFWFMPQTGKYDLVAHYEKKEVVFDPDNPEEPSSATVKRKYYLCLSSNIEGACSFSMASGEKVPEGSEHWVYVYPNPEYKFEGWKINGVLVSTDLYYYFTMPSANTTLEACFTEIPFDPENPMEPSSSGGNINNSTRKFINLSIGNGSNSVDKTRIVINEAKTLNYDTGTDATKFISNDADYQIYSLDAQQVRYSVNERPLSNGIIPLGIFVKKAGSVVISATRLDCTACLVDSSTDKWVDLASDSYAFESEAGTFEERLYIKLGSMEPVNKLGDVNGDTFVDVTDVVLMIDDILGKHPAGYDASVADVNHDGAIDVTDVVMVIDVILGKVILPN